MALQTVSLVANLYSLSVEIGATLLVNVTQLNAHPLVVIKTVCQIVLRILVSVRPGSPTPIMDAKLLLPKVL